MVCGALVIERLIFIYLVSVLPDFLERELSLQCSQEMLATLGQSQLLYRSVMHQNNWHCIWGKSILVYIISKLSYMLALKDPITGSHSNSEGKHGIRAHFKYNYTKYSAKLHSSVYVCGICVAGFSLQHGYHSNPTTTKHQHTSNQEQYDQCGNSTE